ncbi:MAG: hypothetical protein JETT_3755 [Candidatus Jettenia ecosi]|uniref:Uncharacterized protein n=1 Tax=Candidatus Jettenia ecosi TaxID=2494326 RepID=A0A533Q785_9BACT|nr:MAG: hypothetical protein JETT_3755 [Candidatus Jettenia ecosi]
MQNGVGANLVFTLVVGKRAGLECAQRVWANTRFTPTMIQPYFE